MRLLSLGVRSFGCVEQAQLTLGPGLNVLFGPNDLGKSTLARAIRAALLLPSSHKEAEAFRPWHGDAIPEVTLVLHAREEVGSTNPPRTWRVRKAFGGGRRSQAELEWSNDGVSFALEDKGSGVDVKLRRMLGWGVPQARSRGARGFPSSFLATVLLGPQAGPGSVLSRSLEQDPTESGRERLTEALQALAQDPRFKEVLDEAQRKVDEAFTATGRWKSGKKSPLSPIRGKIDALSEEVRQLELRVHESDDVRDLLAQLERERAEAVEARDEAQARWGALQEALERDQQRRLAQEQVQRAREALDEARGVIADLRTWRDAVERHLRDRPAAEAALARAREVEQAASHGLADAQAVLRAIEEGGDAEAKLSRQQLETRRLELRAELERVNARLTRAEQAQALQTRVEDTAEQRDALARDLAAAEREATEAEVARRDADADKRLYDAALRLRRWQEARARVEQAEQARAEVERLLGQAQAREEQARALDEALAEPSLPSAPTLEAWRRLAQQRQVAEARLGVGLQVVVRGPADVPLKVSRDDDPAQAMAMAEPIEARRRLHLRLGEDTQIEVRGGDPGARAAYEELDQRWSEQVRPTLERLGTDDLAEVQQRVAAAAGRRGEAEAHRREAEGMRQLAAARRERAAELPGLRATVEGAEQALAGLDRESLQARVGEHDEAELHRRRAHADARIDESRHRHAQAKSRAASLESQRDAHVREHERLSAELTELRATLPGDPEAERDAAFDALAAIEGELQSVDDELAAHDQARERRRKEADAAVVAAQAELDRARVDSARAGQQLDDRKQQLAQAEGRLAQLEVQAERIDEPDLLARLEERRAALLELPEPEHPVDADALARADATRQAARQALRELETTLEQQRGALKQVGGAVAREEAQRTLEALDAARRAERDLELDYDAWQLLAQTLREAETAEGRHLGDVLGDDVHTRFAALTGDRYGALSLDRNLQAEGLEAAGALRDVDALSEGVRDQLATILRLAIAEHLGTALVLDDHLVQTDPARVAWFRELLLEVGQRAQIVVLTCRPEDYLRDDERPADGEAVRDRGLVRAVDLQQVIERA
ncbi:MAG: AAA family ATPase [Nannocystaceae bacterium]